MAGTEKARKFQFLREIASGGFGSVYLTKITHPDGFSRLTAVKLLHRRWSDNEEISRRMRDEARLLGWLRHRNIVDVVDLTSLDGRTAIIMEYLEAVTIKEVIRASSYAGERLPLRGCFQVMMATGSALDAAYNRPPYVGEKPLRVIHRDIKPSNIMVDDSGHVKVLDFGVARADFAERESHTRELQFGSVDYMPPERLMFEPESPGSDIYSLAATGFETLTLEKLGKAKGSPLKHTAFVAERVAFLKSHLNLEGPHGEAIAALFLDCLAYEPPERPDASQVVSRCRLLARESGGLGLSEWSEANVPAILHAAGLEEPTSMNPLAGRTFYEDAVPEEEIKEAAQQAWMNPHDETIAENDPRWDSLRLAAAAEIEILERDVAAEKPQKASSDAVVQGDDSNEDEVASVEEPVVIAEEPELVLEAVSAPGDDSSMEGDTETETETEIPDSETADSLDELGPSLSATMTLGNNFEPEDMDEVATTMMPIPKRDEPEEDATMMMDANTPLLAEELATAEEGDTEDEFDDGATRILDVESRQSMEEPASEPPAEEPPAEEPSTFGEPMDGETIVLTDDTKNLLEGEAILGARGPVEADVAPPPFMSESIGSETILAHDGPELGSSTAPTGTVSTSRRLMASMTIFLVAMGAGLGLGSILFKEELYGENGVLKKFMGSEEVQTQGGGEESLVDAQASTYRRTGQGNASEESATDPATDEKPSTGDKPEAVVSGDANELLVRSKAPNTKRLVVRCEGKTFKEAASEIIVALGDAESCSVTAYLSSGARLRTKITDVNKSEFDCFENGEKRCE